MQSTTSFHEFKKRVLNNYSENDDGTNEYEDWMLSVKATLGILTKRPPNFSIYKVPNKFRKLKEDAYNPHVVSIGPFHASNHELASMVEHKWRYMLDFVRRAAPPAEEANDQGNEHPSVKALEGCGKAISELEKDARACYAENINLDKYQLVEILLLDGCFILELLIKHGDQDQDEEEDCNQPPQELDPVINNLWMVPTLQHDLALLENQIPFFVLQTLFDTANKQFQFSLKQYVLLFFRSALNLSYKAIQAIQDTRTHKYEHIADLLHHAVYTPPSNNNHNEDLLPHAVYTPPSISNHKIDQEKIEREFKRSATELVKSGIQFQHGNDKDRRLLDIKFSGGVITIPPLDMQEITDSVFRNLVAFEQCSARCSRHMASYAWLMKTLIRSPQDAKFLRQQEIIKTTKVGGDEEVSTFFQSLCREVVIKDFCYSGFCEQVNEYKNSWLHWGRIKAAVKVRWNENIETLHNDYFKSPWTIIFFLAAVVVLLLTFFGTLYTILSYYHH